MAMQVTTATIALQALFLILITLPSFSHQVSFPKPGGGGGGGGGSRIVLRLIHRDSPGSPFYNPNATRADLWKSARLRSSLRHNYIQSALTAGANYSPQDAVILPASRIGGEYITKLIIGTPPTEVFAVMDTGSHLIWVNCLPCKGCTNKTSYNFDPSKSFTYEKFDCGTLRCGDFADANKCDGEGKCAYQIKYADGTYSVGILSSDNFTMPTLDQDAVSYPNTVFGCSSEIGGTLQQIGVGIVGLSRSQYSLISQVGIDMNWKFSYCFEPRTINDGNGGELALGDVAVLLGNSTKMYAIGTNDGTFYVLNLLDISVGSEKLRITPETFGPTEIARAGMVIDSGSTFTHLKTDAFEKLLKKLKEVIKLKPSSHPISALCYQGSSNDLTVSNIPVVTFNFLDLDVALPPTNTFIQVDDNTICLAMVSTISVPLFGNVAQQNMSVGYDLVNQKVYIASTGCTQD